MLRARLAVGLCVAGALAGAVALLVDGGASRAQERPSCTEPEATYTTDTLNDIRSFADAMAIVRGVRQAIPPPPSGPEGWAGLIGRHVTVKVERILWRRPHAPEPPRRFRFDDWGWVGTLENRRPIRVCGETRMAIGRRYLAPIVRHNGTWYPFFPTRLRLRGDLVVGGVDGGEPENSHQALVGRSVRSAVRLVAETSPYRAVVRHPEGSPARRWQAVYRDDYRIWRAKPGMHVIVDSGVTARSRWQLYLRLPRRGGMCVGISARPLWRPAPAPSGEGCGPRTLPPRSMRPGLFFSAARGLFVFGRARDVSVRVRFDGEDWREILLTPTPIPPGGRDYFWVAPAELGDLPAEIQAVDRNGAVVDEERIEPFPENSIESSTGPRFRSRTSRK
jgi:hypothetical protein